MKELILECSLNIPIQQYSPIKVSAGIKVEKDMAESDEDLFLRAHNQLQSVLEAETVIQTRKFLRIANDEGLLNWAKSLADDESVDNNRFLKAFINTVKMEKK